MSELSEKFRMAREMAGLTQQQAANLSGIGYKTINNYENAASRPDVEKLAILCSVYQVSADFFIATKSKTYQPSKSYITDSEYDLIKNHRQLDTRGQEENHDLQQARLLHNYDCLNAAGKIKLSEYSDDLIASGKYTSDSLEISGA